MSTIFKLAATFILGGLSLQAYIHLAAPWAQLSIIIFIAPAIALFWREIAAE